MNITPRPFVELTSASAIRFTLKWQVVGLGLLAAHILLAKQSILLFPVMLMVLAWLYANAPLAGLIAYFQFLIYQNWMLGLLCTDMDKTTFTMVQGSNFAILSVFAGLAALRLMTPQWQQSLKPALYSCLLAIGLACAYAVLGAAKGGPTSASIYFRETTSLVLAVLVGLDVGRVWGYRTIAISFLTSAAFSILCCIVEYMAPIFYYDITNAVNFMKIKNIGNTKLDTFYTPRDVMVGNMSSFFNTSADQSGVDSTMLRYMGTLMHPISNAYIVAAFGLVAFSIRYGLWMLLIIPMMLLSGVKGAVIMLICSMCLWVVWSSTQSRQFLLLSGLGLMVAYVGYGLVTGLNGGDYHVIGFMGGVRGLTHVPWGHGIGVGGNLSTTAENGFNWQDFQHGGVADFALESAVGVFFYQMGIASFAVLAVPIVLLRMAPFGTTWRRRLVPRRPDMIFIVLGCIAVNGVFQEEAYSPYAAGLYTLLAAVLVANGRRETSVMVQERLPHVARMAHG